MPYAAEFLDISPKECWMWRDSVAPADVVILLLSDKSIVEDLPALHAQIMQAQADTPLCSYALVGFSPINWNRDFTPWAAPKLYDEPFEGKAHETLDWITEHLLPQISKEGAKIGILGYSLAGLMALWSCCETDVFALCGSCSGSLWYDGFAEYLSSIRIRRSARIYLSLGDKEEKARNPRLARVGDATRTAYRLLAEKKNVSDCILEWNPGGHFNEHTLRLARALIWLLKRDAEI